MSFRAKLKKKFGRKSITPSPSSTPDAASGESTPHHIRSDIEYYKPHEVPKSKYRGRIDPVHQEKLHAYSFADAFGRRASSIVSGAFSPRGTKAQSRRASLMSIKGRDSKSLRRKSVAPNPVKENESDDTDVANAGLSRSATTADAKPEDSGDSVDEVRLEKASTASNDTPFLPEELERAMTAATLNPRDGSVAVQADPVETH